MEEKLVLNGKDLTGTAVKTAHTSILLISGSKGFLGCGYLSMATAEKMGDALAIVRGVKDFNDMLAASVQEVSAAAAELGVKAGMTGKEALELFA